MNGSILALVFTGLLLTIIGLFVAGQLGLIALGVASLVAAGLLERSNDPVAR
jgi:hypothetical protein